MASAANEPQGGHQLVNVALAEYGQVAMVYFVCVCVCISHIIQLTPQQQSAEPRNSAGAEALAVGRRPKEASREKNRPCFRIAHVTDFLPQILAASAVAEEGHQLVGVALDGYREVSVCVCVCMCVRVCVCVCVYVYLSYLVFL